MKIIFNLLNGLTRFNLANIKLINCVLATSLLISTPSYALDGAGWGELIKGVTEILHNNQQQEIKQREEEQRLEQQRLQEQQQLRQQLQQQMANNGNGSSSNCDHKINRKMVELKKWTGGCSNGYLYGEGELIVSIPSQNTLQKLIGKFSDGFYSGILLKHDLEENGQIPPITNEMLAYYENDNGISIPVAVKINNRLQTYAYKDFEWYAVAADKTLDRKISFDEAMQIVKNFMATKSSDTMSYERFRAYLEGKLSFDPSQTLAQQTNSTPSTEIASASEVSDEPPSKGIFLDRRKKPSSKKKK